jgi:hypothetical protein
VIDQFTREFLRLDEFLSQREGLQRTIWHPSTAVSV